MVLMATSFLICFILTSTDINSKLMLVIHANPILPTWFWSISNLGGDAFVVLLLLLMCEQRPGMLTSWVLKIWLLGAIVVQSIKFFFPMPRPASVLGVDRLSLIDSPPLVSSSMPSGHALAAISCGLVLMIVMNIRGVKKLNVFLVGFAFLISAWSRVAVGAHWPSDVIAGAALGVLVLVMASTWEHRATWNQWFTKSQGRIFLIVLHLLIAIYFFQPQSELRVVQLIQLGFSGLSLYRAYSLFKAYFFNSLFLIGKKQ
jgi:membrane-associated phospholipid phosphatase